MAGTGHRYDGCPRCRERSVESARLWREANPEKHQSTQRASYARNREKYLPKHRAVSQRLRGEKLDFVREVVGTTCVDCAEDRTEAIQYHHPHGRDGRGNPLWNCGWERLKEEVMHIIALCGTCHFLRHRGALI